MSMTAPKSDSVTAPQHHFSETMWSQHSETALKVHGLCCAIKLPKSSSWPTDYEDSLSLNEIKITLHIEIMDS